MDVILEEKRYDEGKELAFDLIRHGVRYTEIAEILGVASKVTWEWMKKVERTGWVKENPEIYTDPEAFELKKAELSKYRGLYGKNATERRRIEKRKAARTLYEQGIPIKEIAIKLNTSVSVLYEWNLSEKKETEAEWIAKWKQEWDEFMNRLVRPIRLEGKLYVE